jgi:hypothetical protein
MASGARGVSAASTEGTTTNTAASKAHRWREQSNVIRVYYRPRIATAQATVTSSGSEFRCRLTGRDVIVAHGSGGWARGGRAVRGAVPADAGCRLPCRRLVLRGGLLPRCAVAEPRGLAGAHVTRGGADDVLPTPAVSQSGGAGAVDGVRSPGAARGKSPSARACRDGAVPVCAEVARAAVGGRAGRAAGGMVPASRGDGGVVVVPP